MSDMWQAWQGGLIPRQGAEHFWSTEVMFSALGHIKNTE